MFGARKVKPDEEEPADIFKRMNDEALRVGAALSDFIGTEGHAALMELLKARRLEVGDRALSDDKRPKEYYQGFRAGACALEELVAEIVHHAEEIRETRATAAEAVFDLGLGMDRGEPVE